MQIASRLSVGLSALSAHLVPFKRLLLAPAYVVLPRVVHLALIIIGAVCACANISIANRGILGPLAVADVLALLAALPIPKHEAILAHAAYVHVVVLLPGLMCAREAVLILTLKAFKLAIRAVTPASLALSAFFIVSCDALGATSDSAVASLSERIWG